MPVAELVSDAGVTGLQEAALREAAARGLPPYGLGNLGPPPLMPGAHPADAYRLAAAGAMFPPGSRERLEWELDREKRERDARERELRERSLRELERQEKMKRELEMKPPGEQLEQPARSIVARYLASPLAEVTALPASEHGAKKDLITPCHNIFIVF